MSHMDRIHVEARLAAASIPDSADSPEAEASTEAYEDEFGLFVPRKPTRAELLGAAALLCAVAGGLVGAVAFLN